MKWAIVVGLLVLSACSPYGPTGYVTINSYGLNGQDLIQVDMKDSPSIATAVVITVYGDVVLDRALINGERFTLGGQYAQGVWLANKGSTVTHLEPGTHEIVAYSCQETAFSWECGCRSAEDCGHWLKKTITIE